MSVCLFILRKVLLCYRNANVSLFVLLSLPCPSILLYIGLLSICIFSIYLSVHDRCQTSEVLVLMLTLQVEVNTMTNAQCSASDTAYSASDITANMICARDTGKDSCQVILTSHWSIQIT